jgi:hypothetical protein
VSLSEKSKNRRKQYATDNYMLPKVVHEIMRGLGKVRAPQEVLDDKARRLAVPITEIERVLGDPRPGYRERLAELEARRQARLCERRAQRWAAM